MSQNTRRLLSAGGLMLLLGAACVMFTLPAAAQEVSAGITGRVTDASGATVPGANVTARDMNRGTVWTTPTNEEGIYAFPRIPAGTYEVRVEAQGFKTAVRSSIVLELNQRARLDIQLEVGGISETLEVTGATPILNTETTTSIMRLMKSLPSSSATGSNVRSGISPIFSRLILDT